jgi:hypothetical protein
MRTKCLGVAVLACAGVAHAEVTFLTQERRLIATTSWDGESIQASAADFGLFEETVLRTVEFPLPGGGVGRNRAVAGISCTFEFGRFRARGRLDGEGGEGERGGQSEQVFGIANVFLDFTFAITEASDWRLDCDSIDGSGGGQDGGFFRINFVSLTTGDTIFFADRNSGIDECHVLGNIPAGQYRLTYETELRTNDANSDEYDLDFRVPGPGTAAVFVILPLLWCRRR